MRSHEFDNQFQRLVILCESEILIGAFDIEFLQLLEEVKADLSDRRQRWLERLAAMKARQLAFKIELQTQGGNRAIAGIHKVE